MMSKSFVFVFLLICISVPFYGQSSELQCNTPHNLAPTLAHAVSAERSAATAKMVNGFYDVDYDIYLGFNGDIPKLKSYLDSLFNYNQQIFARERIPLRTQGIYIWTVPEPFLGEYWDTGTKLTNYPNYRNNQSADYYLFLQDKFGIGQASVAGLCRSDRFGLASVYDITMPLTFFPNPNFHNRTLSHEIGHLLGSWHTNACLWGPNQNTALDDCGSTPPCSFPTNPRYPPSLMGACLRTDTIEVFGVEPLALMMQTINASCARDTNFYKACLLGRFVAWNECLPDPNPAVTGDERTAVKGIIDGPIGGTFHARVTRGAGAGVGLDSLFNLPYNTVVTLGSYPARDTIAKITLIDKGNAACNVEMMLYYNASCTSTSADLSLTATTPTPTPAQWTPFSVTYTLTNSGAASQNIRVEVPEVVGAVYLGGNVAQASAGTFDGIKAWAVPALGTGQSATLTLNYFNTSSAPKVYFGQVTAMSGSDLDSSPGNNNTGIPNEDDEVRITINGTTQPPACQITATTSGILCNNNGTTTITTDDTWSYVLSVSGSNTGTLGWQTTINGQTVTGTYGTPVTVQGGLISAGSRTFTVSDRSTATCTATVTVAPPAPCSTVQPPGPCTSKSDFPWHEWIAEVQVGSVVVPSIKSAYTDARTTVFDAQVGSNAVALTAEFSYFAYAEYFKIWIDLNNDGTLTDATETVYQGQLAQPANGNARHRTTGSMTIPAGTYIGNRLMRISMQRGSYPTPCETLPFGEVEDYSVRITGANPTCQISAQVSNLLCNNAGTTAISTDDTYSFALTVSGTNTGSTGWQTTINGQTITGSYGTATTVQGGVISAGVRTFTVSDRTTATCTTQVTVTPPAPCSSVTPQPCTSVGVFPWHEWIARVQIGAFDYASGKSTYSDFKSAIAQVVRGQTTPITLTTGYSYFTYNEHFKIWADWNRDGAFDDATETIFQGIATAPANGTTTKTVSGSFIAPASATSGDYRIRISMKRGDYATPCESIPNGEVEEYTLRVNTTQVLQNSTSTTPKTTESIGTNQETISVYPNPAADRVTVRWQDGLAARVSLVAATGASAAPAVESMSATELDVSHLADGLYFVRVEVAGQRAAVRRVVVVRE